MDDAEFQTLRGLLQDASGIKLGNEKRSLVQARLSGRMKTVGAPNFAGYLERVRTDSSGGELRTLIDLLSTNVTSFFREPHHFEHLKNTFLAQRLESGEPDTIRVWSSACSSGEEPYTIGFTLASVLGEARMRRFLVLATDISTRMVRTAHQATYHQSQIDRVPAGLRVKCLEKVGIEHYRVRHSVRDRVRVRRLNLLEKWPMKKDFDVIFCRNALIYFDQETQQMLAKRFFSKLKPGGYFYIGHSESLSGLQHDFEYVGPTIYQRPK